MSFESASRSSLLLEHDLFRKPVSTFRDHALAEDIEIKKAANSGGLGGTNGPGSMPVRQNQIRSERRSRLKPAMLLRTVPTR
jgi:hypothetical protein